MEEKFYHFSISFTCAEDTLVFKRVQNNCISGNRRKIDNYFSHSMKWLLLIALLPFKLFSQDISGLWVGSLYNDTTQKTLRYEVAISGNNGEYTGYSYTTFVLDDREVVGVKSIKIVKQKDHFFLEDVELLYNTYPVPPPKGVKQVSSVSLSQEGNSEMLSGKFITTRTRQYGRQVTGTIKLERTIADPHSKLIAVLNDLGLTNTLSFLPKADTQVAVNKAAPIAKPSAVKPKPQLAAQATDAKPVNVLDELSKRKVETIETVSFTSDSLTLTLYDNGEVDGDSVSVIVNGRVMLEHQRLSTQAITRTIKTPRGSTDSLKVIMYAENLGSIAPNTGLLVIYDGDQRHEITFSGDLQRNAAILLKRKKL